MAVRQPRYSKEEFARRGAEIYERDVRTQLPAGSNGEFVAIDIESGAWELDTDDFAATERLLQREPDAQICLVRAANETPYRLGRAPRREHSALVQ